MSPAALSERWAMLLETRKRSGEWVSTPVNVAVSGDRAYFSTAASTGKAKRLRNFPEVRVTPCTVRGKRRGQTMVAEARRLSAREAELARQLMTDEYPIVFRWAVPVEMRLLKSRPLFYELSGFRAA
jgi:PPOX class probable F420-dependent enzyme